MKSDKIADGEALPSDGVDVTHLAGSNVVSIRPGTEQASFDAYQRAWRANEEHPTLHHAADLVRAWNAYADCMGLDHV